MWGDGVSTTTTEDQRELESKVRELYAEFVQRGISDNDPKLELKRAAHAQYVYGGLGELPSGFSSLDASRPWICFWILHSLALLEHPLPPSPSRQSIIEFVAACQHPGGGFGGGPFQLPHIATTYAAVAALVTLGGADALDVINRETLLQFLLRMCIPAERGGGMTMHEGGEVDVRGCYCALASCHMLGIDVKYVAEACSLGQYVRACQSMEGGIGGEPGNEAHGGYAFCGFAALMLAEQPGALSVSQLTAWASRMQGWMEGGFMGRTCKLVDGCYSLWQGGVFPLLAQATEGEEKLSVLGEYANSIPDAKEMHAAVDALLDNINLEAELMEIKALEPSGPQENALSVAQRAQQRFEAAVEASFKFEEEYKTEAAQRMEHAEVRKADTLMALEEAADAQESLERAREHAESAACAAVTLLENYRKEHQEDSLASNILYDPLALQLWLLVCCQTGARGGLRDKPGKRPDYYHTCYCLSGLSSAQHASGYVLGGQRNLLAAADPLCNVVADKLAEARRHFGV